MLQFPVSPPAASSQPLPLRVHHKPSAERLAQTERAPHASQTRLRRSQSSDNIRPAVDLRNNPKPYLGSFDFDNTLVKWLPGPNGKSQMNGNYDEDLFLRTANTIRDVYPKMAVEINTGRNLSGMQRAAAVLGKKLDKVPVDYLHLVDGDQHYVNDRHLPTTQWLRSLTIDNRERDWESDTPITKDATWQKKERVQQAIELFLQKFGFKKGVRTEAEQGDSFVQEFEQTHDENRKIKIDLANYGDDLYYLSYEFQRNDKKPIPQDDADSLAEMLAPFLALYLKTWGIRAVSEPMESEDPETGKIFPFTVLQPYTTNKTMSIQGTLDRYMTKPKAVITAGDSPLNDLEALSTPFYTHGAEHKRIIPNYPIISGNNPEARYTQKLVNAIEANGILPEHVQQVETGDLGPAIRQQIEQAQKHRFEHKRLHYVI